MPIPIGPEFTEIPERILTVAGWMSVDDGYVPRVVAGEHLHAHPEAKAALAIVARTFVLRSMRDRPTLGRTTPIRSGDNFQVFSRGASSECMAAAAMTRGVVLRYRGQMILANHVAGAPRRMDGGLGADPTHTERWVTYNVGRMGAEVTPTGLSLRSHPGNRGCMGQNCADWLGKQGYDYRTIIQFFFGADIEFYELGKHSGSLLRPRAEGMIGLLALAAIGMVMRR